MDNIYILMLVALAILAITDLVVGVSNDAVNFLNSAIGSKIISFKTILIVASIGILVGAVFSSGLMEVARKGIFHPGQFMFSEIMIIFMAVMIADILLLDLYNTLGMPTSTTVSIVFELLGAAVCMALIKIGADSNLSFSDLESYINTKKATEIIVGILASVVVAFSVGAFVQYFSRLMMTFNFRKKGLLVHAIFGGIALSSILYFIFFKGLKGTAFASQEFDFFEGMKLKDYLEKYAVIIIAINLVVWTIFSYIYIKFTKFDIYKVIIALGTFALALAFAGNDLVNFIGVPIAAWQSFDAFMDPTVNTLGLSASEFSMGILGKKVPTPTLLLVLAGVIMVITLWFSKKARTVTETEISLSNQEDTKNKFEPNFLSRSIVRGGIILSKVFEGILPNSAQARIDKSFEKPIIKISKDQQLELPAFDAVRASMNLVLSGILISIATSYKLPLSTTYVTFMVAMGTSLSDRAWGVESAVYRVAGVLNVIGGWFMTAFIAFTAAAILVFLIHLGGPTMIAVLLLLAVFLLIRSAIHHRKKSQEEKAEDKLIKSESISLHGVMDESSDNIKSVINRSSKIYVSTLSGLSKQDLKSLKKSKKNVTKLNDEIEELNNHMFYFIKNLDESSLGASNFYINILGALEDMSQSLEKINKVSYKHINNNHSKLKDSQITELTQLQSKVSSFLQHIKPTFADKNYSEIGSLLKEKENILKVVDAKIDKQIARTRTEESSPKNTTLYFSILIESKDLIKATSNLLETYEQNYNVIN